LIGYSLNLLQNLLKAFSYFLYDLYCGYGTRFRVVGKSDGGTENLFLMQEHGLGVKNYQKPNYNGEKTIERN